MFCFVIKPNTFSGSLKSEVKFYNSFTSNWAKNPSRSSDFLFFILTPLTPRTNDPSRRVNLWRKDGCTSTFEGRQDNYGVIFFVWFFQMIIKISVIFALSKTKWICPLNSNIKRHKTQNLMPSSFNPFAFKLFLTKTHQFP